VGAIGACTGGFPVSTDCQVVNESALASGWGPSPYCQSQDGSTTSTWSASTTYAAGAGTGYGGHVFVSLIGSNLNNTPPLTATSNASWGVSSCQLDDPAGGTGPGWPAFISDPTNSGAGSTGTGFLTGIGAACDLSSSCLDLSMTAFPQCTNRCAVAE
jgi:hypothetical protein